MRRKIVPAVPLSWEISSAQSAVSSGDSSSSQWASTQTSYRDWETNTIWFWTAQLYTMPPWKDLVYTYPFSPPKYRANKHTLCQQMLCQMVLSHAAATRPTSAVTNVSTPFYLCNCSTHSPHHYQVSFFWATWVPLPLLLLSLSNRMISNTLLSLSLARYHRDLYGEPESTQKDWSLAEQFYRQVPK